MKLKSITIHGFKSFADRVSIAYDDCITGVIGPNGSGKSNVIDAVRWVMGEQTAKSLRADDPTDIIFAGSQTRKPMGMAEVTLTFTNDGKMCPPEYMHLPEVSITRRIFRDGEREYLMNKEACRLKDISTFLMSIGLGSRTYSIIQQEKRDRIVQAKPDDLRAILEETAGITVFKQQRKDAEKRLHSANEQLEKLDAIESELAKQSSHLSEQVEKTKRKIALSKELRDSEIGLLADNIAFYKSISLTLKKELEKRFESTQQSTVDTAGYEAEAARLTAEKLEVHGESQDLEEQINAKKLSLTQLTERRENQLTLAVDREQQLEKLNKTIEGETLECSLQAERKNEAALLMEKSEAEIASLDGEIEGLAQDEEASAEAWRSVQSKLEELRSETKLIRSRSENLATQNESARKTLQALKQKQEEKANTLKSKNAEQKEQEAELKKVTSEFKRDQESLDTLGSEVLRVDTLSEQMIFERKRHGERHEIKHRQLVELDARLRSLAELAEEDEVLKDKVPEALAAQASKFSSFFSHFTLSASYEDKLEQALPELVAALCASETEPLATLLGDSQVASGVRRHFFSTSLLTELNTRELEAKDALLKIPGMVWARHELEKGQDHSLACVFDRIFFCTSAAQAFAAREAHECAQAFCFIFPQGGCLFGHGEARIGKSQDVRAAGVLKRKREMATLQIQRDAMFSEVSALELEMVKLDNSIEDLSNKSKNMRMQVSEQRELSIRREAEIARSRLRLDHLFESIANLENESKEFELEINAAQETLQQNAAQYLADLAELERLQSRLVETEESASDEFERGAELKRVLQDRRSRRGIAAEQLAVSKRTFEELALQIDRSTAKLEKLAQERQELLGNMSVSEKSGESLNEEIEKLRREVGQGESRLEEYHERLAEFTEQIHVLESKISNEKDAQLKFERLLAEKKTELARAETILETQYKESWERFGLSETDFTQTEAPEADNRNKLESKIRSLKSSLENLGPINEAAFTEFEETVAKLDFLRGQKTDIVNSIDVLQNSISEVEERTKVTFMETYTKVGGRFENLFPILFPGGEARLNLVEPENLLETGVEILVRLPGKRMQNMSLFSGGEKALTAISLIFALLQTSPAPFCYLDEVDAPLDEANVGRFNSVLEALSSEFQFVVITHNRRTMEVLDTIYGISMAEPGVSRLVSVDLSEVPGRMQKVRSAKASSAERAGASAHQSAESSLSI